MEKQPEDCSTKKFFPIAAFCFAFYNKSTVTNIRESCETLVNQIKYIPLFGGTKAKFPARKHSFLCVAKLQGLFGIFTKVVDVLVANKTMSIAALQVAFSREYEYKLYYRAYRCLEHYLAGYRE